MNGIVLVFIDESGNAIANVVDFNKTCYGGYTLLESQRHRVRDILATAVVNAYSSPQLARAVEPMDARRIVDTLVSNHKCHIAEVVVGHKSEGGSR